MYEQYNCRMVYGELQMNYFENQMFNPNYVNEDYYHKMQANAYKSDQDDRVANAVRSFKEMLDQIC